MKSKKQFAEEYYAQQYKALIRVVYDFIDWLDSEPSRDWYQYGDIYERFITKVEELWR